MSLNKCLSVSAKKWKMGGGGIGGSTFEQQSLQLYTGETGWNGHWKWNGRKWNPREKLGGVSWSWKKNLSFFVCIMISGLSLCGNDARHVEEGKGFGRIWKSDFSEFSLADAPHVLSTLPSNLTLSNLFGLFGFLVQKLWSLALMGGDGVFQVVSFFNIISTVIKLAKRVSNFYHILWFIKTF